MKYQLTYSSNFVFCWDKRTATIEVDLSSEEVEQIKSVVKPKAEKDTWRAIEKKFPKLSSKLWDAGLDFMWYVAYLDIRLSGMWKECTERDISERHLMNEDIDYEGFNPHDNKGVLLKGQELYDAWVKWEEVHLEGLPFSERSYYYADRYDIDGVNLEDVQCNIIFPSEITTQDI